MLYFKPKLIAVQVIRMYQRTLSFDHGILKIFYPHGFCRYKPTCSEYAIQAILSKGVVLGGFMAFWRVLRCNPFSKGGHDPFKY